MRSSWVPSAAFYGGLIGLPFLLAILLLPGTHQNPFSATEFMPHATCYLRNPQIIALHVISDTLIGLAYLAISATLGYLVHRARRDIPFHWMFLAFGLFIIACGLTHFMEVWTVWQPYYWLAGDVKLVTAVASVATALALPPLVPKVFSMISAVRVSEERRIKLEAAHSQLGRAHQELEGLYAKVKELDSAKSAFFAAVSHELRTPLVLILGPVEQMLAQAQGSAEQRNRLLTMQRNGEILLKRVNDLLDLAKLDAGRMQVSYTEVDLAQLTRLTLASFESIARERQIQFEVKTPASLSAQLDAEKIERVLMNLAANAFQVTADHGLIRCELRHLDGRALISVVDNGPGVPRELREAIFERFRRIEGQPHRTFGGTGLGLSIVREFVQLQKGEVTVDDAPGGGAQFTVTLPLKAPPGVSVQARGGAQGAQVEQLTRQVRAELTKINPEERLAMPADANGAVLVVEDNTELNKFICELLAFDYSTLAAYSGQEALARLAELKPDLVITDLMMPTMDGEQLVAEIRRRPELDATPILLLTAKADDQTRTRLLRSGAQDYLVKPFLVEELRARVGNLVAVKRAQEKLKEKSERLEEVNAELESFSYTVSHDLRAPLRAMQGMATALLEDYADRFDELGQDYARRIVGAGQQMDRLISALLEYSRLSRTELQLVPTALGDTIQEARGQLASVFDERAAQLSVPETGLTVMAHRPMLVQVMTNFFSNALKFVAPDVKPRIAVRYEDRGSVVRVWVNDNGIGIPSEHQERIFRVFERLHSAGAYPGTGIGLAIVQKAIKRMGGRVGVQSAPGEGSQFWIELNKPPGN